jgi:hypothetical protein
MEIIPKLENKENLEKIKHVCSLGSLCHSSQILKRNNLKKCSYPFDWIFSNPLVIFQIFKSVS